MTMSFAIEGKPSPGPSGRFDPVTTHMVMPGYFSTLGVPLLRGRVFDQRDRAGSQPVVVVNQSLARKLWGAEDPIGGRIAFDATNGPWLEVVGVVGDARMEDSSTEPEPILYHPWLQKTWPWLNWQAAIVDGPRRSARLTREGSARYLRCSIPGVRPNRKRIAISSSSQPSRQK